MDVVFTKEAIKDKKHWIKTKNVSVQKRISLLLTDIIEHPFIGIGNPEPLKHHLSGYWSRRIVKDHRLVYSISETTITVISLRFHYNNI